MCNVSRLSHFSTHWIFVANLINTFWLFQMVTWQVTAKIKSWGMLWHVPGFYLPHLILYFSPPLSPFLLLTSCKHGSSASQVSWALRQRWLSWKANAFFCAPYIFQFITSVLLCVPSLFCIPFRFTYNSLLSFCLQVSHAALANPCSTHWHSGGLVVTVRAEGHAGLGRIHGAGGLPSPHPEILQDEYLKMQGVKQTNRMQIWYKVQ